VIAHRSHPRMVTDTEQDLTKVPGLRLRGY
jgi:hypothetical protein